MVVPREEAMIIKRRVLYIGSSVPLETTEGLEAIQQPLRERYPDGDEGQIQGINAMLSVGPSGLMLQYIDDPDTIISFPITSLTICAAVRRLKTVNGATGQISSRFVSLNAPEARAPNSRHPAVFTAITRRTKGRRVLECHGFICSSDKDALDLVKVTSHCDRQFKMRNGPNKRPVSYSEHSALMRVDSNASAHELVDLTQNGSTSFIRREDHSSEVPNVRLIPGENHPKAAPEFYDPPPTQGYFYGSEKAEVKSFNVEKTEENGIKEPESTPRSEVQNGVSGIEETVVPPLQPPPPGPAIVNGVPRQIIQAPPRRPMYVPMRMMPPPPRARFFSPPPSFVRRIPVPYMMPPPPQPPPPGVMFGPPPPGMMVRPPPFITRRPRRHGSHSSDSRSKSSSRSSSPKPDEENTVPKEIPNADLESESDVFRPRTPPRDYEARLRGRERISRRDDYEMRRKREKSPKKRHGSPRVIYPPYRPQYYPMPGYPYMPPYPYGGGRSRSMPPPMNERRYSPDRKKGKKHKKDKKKNKRKHKGAPSDVSHDSYGYHSEIPRSPLNMDGYSFYPPRPRDFRHEENQFLNERSFSHRIQEENRKSKGKKGEYYPTAYELNEALSDGKTPRDADFTMY